METMVWWNAGGRSLNKEVEWIPWYEWNAGGGSWGQAVE